MFGYTLIKTRELQKIEAIKGSVVNCHRWFSGWKDLDIIWEYILAECHFGGISRARYDYAKARGTDEYGVAVAPKARSADE